MDLSCAFFDEIDKLKLQGQYQKARQRLQDAARQSPNDCSIYIHWARLAREAGLLSEAKSCCDRCKAIVEEEKQQPPVDELRLAVIDIFTVLTDYYMVGTSPKAASRAAGIFEDHLRQRSIDDYGPVPVMLMSNYYNFRHRLKISGDERYLAAPKLGPTFFWDLYRSMMQQQRFLDAFHVVNSSRTDDDEAGESLMAELLDDMLSQASIPDSIRAMCMDWKSQYIASTKPGRQWVPVAQEALKLYQAAGNVSWADDTRLQLIKDSGRKIKLADASQELFQIQERAEELGFMSLAVKALQTIEELHYSAFTDMSPSVAARVTPQLQRLRQMCQSWWLDIYHLSMHISAWISRGDSEAKLLPIIKQFHQRAKDMNLTFQTVHSASLLRNACMKLGDGDAIDACIRNLPSGIPSRFLRMSRLDPFYEELDRTTHVPDPDQAFEKLCLQIEAAKVYIPATESLQMRGAEVAWFSDVQNRYSLLAVSDPSFEPARFFEKCSEAIRGFCAYLSEDHADKFQYHLFSNEANFHFLTVSRLYRMVDGKFPQDIQVENDIALGLFKEAAASRYCSKDAAMKATSHGMIAACHKNRWLFQSLARESDEFREADRNYRLAVELSRSCANLTVLLLTMGGLLNLWKLGVDWSIAGFEEQPSEILLGICREYEELSTLQRVDRSALKSSRALLAKQASRNNDGVQAAFETAINLLASGQDGTRLWAWLQGSKSRSVSDMLALGIKIPADLTLAIEEHSSLAEMLEEEETLIQQLSKSEGSDFALRRELEALQKSMRQIPVLQRVFALREGRATTLDALATVSRRWNSLRPGLARKTVFVDWFIRGERNVYCMLVTDHSSSVQFEDTGLTLQDIEMWKRTYYEHTDDDDEHNLNLSGYAALAELSKLIQLVLRFSDHGDLLVLCPASTLHGLPLHAALIDGTGDRSLIERNPVVYTSSMTTFEYCVSRQLDASSEDKATETRNSFVAVFESLENESLNEFGRVQREQIYASVRNLAEGLPGSSTTLGLDASPERMADAFDAEFVSFFGHCSFEPSDYLDQGLVLVAKADDSEAVTTTLFTASQMFDINVRASNVMLMACGSAMQSHTQGDEPLGITTALLCVGASSVTGTLWKTRVPTALAFNSAFHVALSREQEASDSGILDLAKTVQTAICRLKRRPETRSPLQWASFVLNGSWFMKQSGRP